MSALAVHVRRKHYRQGDTLALQDVRFRVDAGQFVALVGPSGAGKTSLLNIVAGLDRDFTGEVTVDGAATPMGVVFQSPRLMPWLSVLDNIRLVLPESAGDDPQAVRALLRELELEGFENAFPGRLSGGMQRRVGLARAFAVHPRLLLMDEPFVSLDAPLARRLRELLLSLWSRLEPTVLYVTHDLTEALTLADRVLFLSPRPGHIVLDETVPLPRPRDPGGARVAALHADLLARHPELLSGRAGGEAGRPAATGTHTGAGDPAREAPAA